MATSRKPPKSKSPALALAAPVGLSREKAAAVTALLPTVQAALTVQKIGTGVPDLDLVGLVDALGDQVSLANSGDLGRGEAMLVSQAHTLDAIFHTCARRASMNMGDYLPAAETYLRLALKAQSQCRTTWETLAEIKNPRSVAFVRQANVTTGPQQVNNGPLPEQGSRARENAIEPNKLMEQSHGQRLDPGTAGAAGGIDTHLEAVGAINRAEDAGG